jgi:hypothetical protein
LKTSTAVLALFLVSLSTDALARTVIRTRVVLTPGRLAPAGVSMDGFTLDRTPARPALPERGVRVALHPWADLATLTLEVKSGPTDVLPRRRELPPNPPRVIHFRGRTSLSWAGARTVLAGRDLSVYGNDRRAIFPREVVRRQRVTNRRGLRVLHLRYTPLRYRHGTRELLLDRHTEVTVSYRLASSAAPFRPDPQLTPHLDRVANPVQAHRWHRSTLADGSVATGYAVVIPEALRKASKRLADFIKHKQSLGMAVTVVSESDLASIKVGSEGGDAERVRGWLQANYIKLNLRYVLLVGNPDPSRAGVPMKLTHAMVNHHKYPMKPPSDYYYADLTGNWDLDGDGDVGEYPDDSGDGGVDFTPEVYVGRIPIYDNNAAALDHVLEKTIRYATEAGDRAWRRRVLQPAAMLFYKGTSYYRMDGADMAEAIFDQVIKGRGLTRFRLYEEDGLDPSKIKGEAPLTRENVIDEWKRGYGLVTWFGHGSPSGVFRTVWESDKNGDGEASNQELDSPAFFTYDDTVELDDTRPSFVFHGSCSNGQPESPDNIGYGLLLHGAVGTVSSSREALVVFESGAEDVAAANIFGVERDFTKNLLDAMPAGEAHYRALEKVSEKLGMISWLTKMQLNLYGDPSIALAGCSTDADCDDGDVCTGEESCQGGQCTAGKQVVCTSPDPCQEASCEAKTGKCTVAPRPDDEACDDGKFCTVDEVCKAGVCQGKPRCAADGNPCVEARCDEDLRTCDVHPLAEGLVCHEGSDRQGICTAGVCEPDDAGGCSTGGSPAGLPGLLLLIALGSALLGRHGRRRRRR